MSSGVMLIFTVEDLKNLQELGPMCSEHGKIKVLGSIISILKELPMQYASFFHTS